MKITLRSEATGRYYFTGKPCHRGHVARRYTRCGKCIECSKEDRLKLPDLHDLKLWVIQNPTKRDYTSSPSNSRYFTEALKQLNIPPCRKPEHCVG